MNNEYELPVISPDITCFLHHAHYLTALKTHPSYYNWLYSNFIQLVLRIDCLEKQEPGNHLLNFLKIDYSYGVHHACPFMKLQIINSELLMAINHDIISVLKNFILRDNYVNIYLDDFYIASKTQYQKRHFIHDHLIHGFNNNSFMSYGYDSIGNLTTTYIDYETIKHAMVNNENYPINLFSPNLNITTSIDLINIKELLNDYINAFDSTKRLHILTPPKKNRIYGMGIYPYLIKYLEYVNSNDEKIDLRIISVLIDHKSCMYKRICFLMKNNYIINDEGLIRTFLTIYEETKIVGNIAIKYNLTLNNKFPAKIQEKLTFIASNEKIAIKNLINIIKI